MMLAITASPWLAVRTDVLPGLWGKVLRAPFGRAEPCLRQSRGTRWKIGGWGAPDRESGAPPPGPEIWSRFRAGAGLQTPVCHRVQACARQLELTRRYRLRLRQASNLRVGGSNPSRRATASPTDESVEAAQVPALHTSGCDA